MSSAVCFLFLAALSLFPQEDVESHVQKQIQSSKASVQLRGLTTLQSNPALIPQHLEDLSDVLLDKDAPYRNRRTAEEILAVIAPKNPEAQLILAKVIRLSVATENGANIRQRAADALSKAAITDGRVVDAIFGSVAVDDKTIQAIGRTLLVTACKISVPELRSRLHQTNNLAVQLITVELLGLNGREALVSVPDLTQLLQQMGPQQVNVEHAIAAAVTNIVLTSNVTEATDGLRSLEDVSGQLERQSTFELRDSLTLLRLAKDNLEQRREEPERHRQFLIERGITGTVFTILVLSLLLAQKRLRSRREDAAQARREIERVQSENAELRRAEEIARSLPDVQNALARFAVERYVPLFTQVFERERVRIAFGHAAAEVVSGDFYNVFTRSDGTIGVYMVDVVDHGIEAAIQATFLAQLLLRVITNDKQGSPRRILQAADHAIAEDYRGAGVATTMNLLLVNSKSLRVEYANAGMPAPFLFRSGGSFPESLLAAGLYVGDGYSKYEVLQSEEEVQCHDGDVIVLVSDGILLEPNKSGGLFGREGVVSAVLKAQSRQPSEIVQALLREVKERSSRPHPDDDQTVVAIALGSKLDNHRETAPPLVRALDSVGQHFEISNADGVLDILSGELLKAFGSFVRSVGYSDESVDRMWQSLWEALINAIRHGSSRGEELDLRFITTVSGEAAVEIRQPRHWHNWDEVLGEKQREAMMARRSKPSLQAKPCGADVILRESKRIDASDLGKTLRIIFPQPAGREIVHQ